MTSIRRNEQGISALIVLLLLIVVPVGGFAAWRVIESDTTDTPPVATETVETEEAGPETTYVKPESGAFQVVLPEGWTSGTCPDNVDVLFLAPSADKLGKCATEFVGSVVVSENEGTASDGYTADDYKNDEHYGDVKSSAITIDGMSGYKVSYTIIDSGLVGYPPVGTKVTDYRLDDGSHFYLITYTQFAGEADLSSAVQELAESFDRL